MTAAGTKCRRVQEARRRHPGLEGGRGCPARPGPTRRRRRRSAALRKTDARNRSHDVGRGRVFTSSPSPPQNGIRHGKVDRPCHRLTSASANWWRDDARRCDARVLADPPAQQGQSGPNPTTNRTGERTASPWASRPAIYDRRRPPPSLQSGSTKTRADIPRDDERARRPRR